MSGPRGIVHTRSFKDPCLTWKRAELIRLPPYAATPDATRRLHEHDNERGLYDHMHI